MHTLFVHFTLMVVVLTQISPCQNINITKEFEYDRRISKLEASIKSLVQDVTQLKNDNLILTTENKVLTYWMTYKLKASKTSWELKRVEVLFPSLLKIQLHETKPNYLVKIPLPLPSNTKAVIISLFCNFWNVKGHAYLYGNIQQKGNVDGGAVKVFNQHFNVYANTWYYEMFLPWNSTMSSEIEFNVTGSYLSGGDKNWYQLKMVGYVTV